MAEAFDYAKAARTALGLVEKFGGEVRLRRQASSQYNVTTSKASSTGVEEICKGALLPYAPYVVHSSNGVIKQEDQQLILATENVGAEPKPGDVAVAANKTYTVVNVQTIRPSPGGEAVVYVLQVRR